MNVSTSEINDYIRTSGKRADFVLSTLNKNKKFIDAISSDIGVEILRDSAQRMDYILEKIINEEAKDAEIAEFRALKHISIKWMEKINCYYTNINKIKKGK